MSLYAIPCVLFAGGKSSRMGEDKAFLPFAGHPSLVQYQYERLEEIFEHVYISAKDKNKYTHFKAVVIEDLFYKEVSAPTVGLVNAFSQLKDENSFFVLSVDTPFVDKDLIGKLLEARDSHYDAIIARTPSGIHPLCGVYTRALEERLNKMTQNSEHKLMTLLKNANVLYIDIEEEEALLNLNTPPEYQKALEILKARF